MYKYVYSYGMGCLRNVYSLVNIRSMNDIKKEWIEGWVNIKVICCVLS